VRPPAGPRPARGSRSQRRYSAPFRLSCTGYYNRDVRGVFISNGSDIQFAAGSIRIDFTSGTVDPVVPNLRIDTWNHWILVAREAQVRAESALQRVVVAHEADDNIALGQALEEEFRNGMLAISASAFAIDAFYASVKERHLPHPQTAEWQANRLARYKQVSETFRWTWNVKPKPAKQIREALRQLYKFRDSAVHSPAEFRPAMLREDIDRGVEWRFIHFRAENSAKAIQIACEVIEAFLRNSARAPGVLREWIVASRSRFSEAAGYEIRQPDEPVHRAIE